MFQLTSWLPGDKEEWNFQVVPPISSSSQANNTMALICHPGASLRVLIPLEFCQTFCRPFLYWHQLRSVMKEWNIEIQAFMKFENEKRVLQLHAPTSAGYIKVYKHGYYKVNQSKNIDTGIFIFSQSEKGASVRERTWLNVVIFTVTITCFNSSFTLSDCCQRPFVQCSINVWLLWP